MIPPKYNKPSPSTPLPHPAKSNHKTTQISDDLPAINLQKQSRHILYFRERRKLHKMLVSSILMEGDDGRPYGTVKINNFNLCGILDSGASVSILGAGCEKFLEDTGLKLRGFPSSVQVANGAKQRVLGFVVADVTFNGQTFSHKLFLVPSLQQPLYLGIDFWKRVGIRPAVEEINITPPEINEDEENRHILSPDDTSRLQSIVDAFPSLTRDGLGRTTLLKHDIELTDINPIKQRAYAVSPAVQTDLYTEIDRMIRSDVIEEINSPCGCHQWRSFERKMVLHGYVSMPEK